MIQIDKKNNEGYEFELKTKSGQTLLKSLPFPNEAEANKAFQSLKTEKEPLNRVERKTDHRGNFLFLVKNLQGDIIGKSNLYTSEAGMENGIKNFKKLLQALSDF